MKRLSTLGILLMMLLSLAVVHAQDNTTVEPPPTDYSEVADDYAEISSYAVTEGAAVVDQFISGELDTLYERFSDEMQAAISLEQLETGYNQLSTVGAIGERVDYRVFTAPGARVYYAVHTWGEDQQISITAAFNEADEISGLGLQPVNELPEDPAADYQSEVTFRLPFDGLWHTFWGGPDVLHNYHTETAPQRHAYDFVIWKDGSTFSGEGTANADYYAYGQTVLSPADGEVITVVNDLPESLPQVETDAEHPAGNHVVIQAAENEYLYLAHMQPGSILVEVGDTVTTGQPIGLVGNSGNTSEPHLHIHLQDQPEMITTNETGAFTGITDAIGLPLQFSNYLSDGEPVEIGEPLGGQFVQNAE